VALPSTGHRHIFKDNTMTNSFFKNEKYEATGETKDWFGITLYRIRAVADIAALGITLEF
jgi:hypothetical protein